MKKLLTLICVLFTLGCQAAPKSFDQGLALIDKAAEIAQKQGTAYTASICWDGKLGGGWIQRAELDSGVTVEVNFHGNAASERATLSDGQ
ncbi:MAG: hypothetical protein ACXAC5_00970 [Promethearchaeota archaeon]|jgi:hypothetical protein